MHDKLVSVIIPAYNVGEYIEKCVKSILNQTHKNVEILIYNDGSTDNTLTKLKKLVRIKNVLVFNSKRNKGVSVARNFLFEKAKGEYIMLQDADDMSMPLRIEKCLDYLEKNDCLLVSCNIQTSDKHIFAYDIKDEVMTAVRQFQCHKPMGGASSFFHRSIIDAGIRYDTDLLTGEDYLFDVEIQSKFPFKMRGLPDRDAYYWYRKREGSLSSFDRREELIPDEILDKRNRKIRNIMEAFMLAHKDEIMRYFEKEPNLYVNELKVFYEGEVEMEVEVD